MANFDVIIIGGGPSGLAAGLYLTRGKYRTLLIEKESFGGQLTKIERIENYPGFQKGIEGPALASEMLAQAVAFGLEVDLGEVISLEAYSRSRSVQMSDGRNITAKAVVIASGCRRMKLGVPGETEFDGNGVIGCALCDGQQLAGKKVAVCGGGDTGITEALYMTKLALSVVLLEATPEITASPILQERARADQKLEIRCGVKVTSIRGETELNAIELEDSSTGKKEILPVGGVLVDIGLEPNTEFISELVPLDARKRIAVNEKMETGVPYIYAAGDVRSGSPGQVVTGVADGAVAAIAIQKLLQQES